MFRRTLLRIGDFIFVTRPLILIPVWSFFLLGNRNGRVLPAGPVHPGAPGWGFLCLTAIMVTAYLINQVFDQDTDRHNNKGHYLTRGILSVRTVVLMALVSFVAASLSFQYTAAAQRPVLVTALILSLVYSLPPLRLCARPIVDLIANAIGYGGLAFLAGYLAWDDNATAGALTAMPYVLLVGGVFMHTTILDVDGDRATGKFTSTVLMGKAPSAWLALVLALLGLVWELAGGSGARDVLTLVVLGVPLPLFVAAAVAHARAKTRAETRAQSRAFDGNRMSSLTVQAATGAVAIAAAVVEPRYLALVVPIVALGRVYYRERFGVFYPGITGDGGGSSPPA